MYSLAPASHIMLNNVGSGPTHEGPIYNRRSETLAALANRATSASREMLNTLVDVLEPSTMLKYVPATLVMETVPTEANDDVRLLRTSILAIRNGSPDDTHMAVRYARFLEVLLDSSHYSSRADTPAGVQGEQSTSVRDGLGISDMESHSDTTRYMMMPNDSDLTDVLNELGNVGDLVNWAEDPFGRLEEMGFLPNV
ncbi:uncharacterized protein CTRU02_215389 [Colletotrichum truncatum]|uniref:Uncharacterized protein n=1 Tax=Colletotrichum truncatum TaxID=5467 RepID=A0ACC3YDB0_COLTU